MLKINLQTFAAGDPIAITNNKITALNTFQTVTIMAADQDTIDATQDFIYTPTGKDNKIAVFISAANSHGAVATKLVGGVGAFGIADKTDSVAQNTTEFAQIETGRFRQTDGTLKLTLTPASGKRLTSDHAVKVYWVELQ